MTPITLLAAALVSAGCASFHPTPLEEIPFLERAETATDGKVRVTVAVLTAAESKQAFDVNLAKKGIQPVWLDIENSEDFAVWLFPISVDPEYYSPYEAAWICHHFLGGAANHKMDEYFYQQQIPLKCGPGQTTSGFVFTHLDYAIKVVTVDLYGEKVIRRVDFTIIVPGFKADFQRVDFDNLYAPDEITALDESTLTDTLRALPKTTTNKAGTAEGDPVNFVLIGDNHAILPALARRGWHITEPLTAGTALKTGLSAIFSTRYRYSPISALYVYGRPQDIALQKARDTIHERNHLRMWRAPFTYEGLDVWVGQISRDIGVRFTTKAWNLTTHKIDPDIDEARDYLFQDLVVAQAVAEFGFLSGGAQATPDQPGHNLTGDPYFTDGLRMVLRLTDEPTSVEDVLVFDWNESPGSER